MSENKICFVIALKYYRNYETFIKYYVDNIQSFYKDSFIIIVDNNSTYIQDIHSLFHGYSNLIIITNETDCKFEIGAYKVGIKYLLTNDLLDTYEYIVFTQDNFVIKNKYDFNLLKEQNTLACSLVTWRDSKVYNHHFFTPLSQNVLSILGLTNNINNLSLCWCSSFILHSSKIIPFMDIVKNILITSRDDSSSGERFLSGILYRLNNNIIENIDGDMNEINNHYNGYNIDLVNDDVKTVYFVKKLQQKTEKTVDI